MMNEINRIAAAALTVLGAALWTVPALAVQPLQGRTITGAAVASNDPSAVMEYDPNLNVTWLRNWNVQGGKSWADQVAWAANYSVGGFAGWALPTASAGCTGYSCTGSQMGYLFFIEGYTPSNPGRFQDMPGDYHWSGTAYASNPDYAWYFRTSDGYQELAGKGTSMYAVAVRPGDVSAAVPEQHTGTLMLIGLGAVTVTLRRPSG